MQNKTDSHSFEPLKAREDQTNASAPPLSEQDRRRLHREWTDASTRGADEVRRRVGDEILGRPAPTQTRQFQSLKNERKKGQQYVTNSLHRHSHGRSDLVHCRHRASRRPRSSACCRCSAAACRRHAGAARRSTRHSLLRHLRVQRLGGHNRTAGQHSHEIGQRVLYRWHVHAFGLRDRPER